MTRKRWIGITTVMLFSRLSHADEPMCSKSNPADLRAVFAEAISLDLACKRTAESSTDADAYKAARNRVEQFQEENAIPCAEAATQSLLATPNEALAQSLLSLAAAFVESADETLPYSLARLFAERPNFFRESLRRLPTANRCPVLDSLQTGWINLKPTVKPGQVADRERVLQEMLSTESCAR